MVPGGAGPAASSAAPCCSTSGRQPAAPRAAQWDEAAVSPKSSRVVHLRARSWQVSASVLQDAAVVLSVNGAVHAVRCQRAAVRARSSERLYMSFVKK